MWSSARPGRLRDRRARGRRPRPSRRAFLPSGVHATSHRVRHRDPRCDRHGFPKPVLEYSATHERVCPGFIAGPLAEYKYPVYLDGERARARLHTRP